MGASPEAAFRETSIHEEKKGSPVPIENFLNAQCKLIVAQAEV